MKKMLIALVACFALVIVTLVGYLTLYHDDEVIGPGTSSDAIKTGKEIEREYLFKEEKYEEIPTEYEEDTLLSFISEEDGQKPFETEVVKLTDDVAGLEGSIFNRYTDANDSDFITLMQYILKYFDGKDMVLCSVTQCPARVYNCVIRSDESTIRFVTGKPKDVPDDSIKIYLYVAGD